ncbi:hypothetical protein OESDEN_25408, partial [Oesophagostomum dentatum]
MHSLRRVFLKHIFLLNALVLLRDGPLAYYSRYISALPSLRWTGDSHAMPVFDLSPVEFDPSELEVQGAVEREIVTIGGKVQSLSLSPDGQRLAVNFAGKLLVRDTLRC